MKKYIQILVIFSIVLVICLSARDFYLYSHNPMLNADTQTADTRTVSPQKLFDKTWHTIKNEYYDSNFNHQKWSKWKTHYQGKIKTQDDAKVAIETMVASLDDPYTRFLTKEEFERQNTAIASKMSGIGVNIINDSGKIKILSVIENTPAQYADLKAGDIILTVNNEKVSGLSLGEVANKVKGPINSFVNLEILRGKDKISKNIIRKEITIKTVNSYMDKKIGYIQISSFISDSAPNEFLEALENTSKSEGLIIDLRGNTGGLLGNAIFIANLFIENGKLVSIVGRNGYRYDIMAKDTNVHINKPIILLVDGTSASASEILSGAMKDYKKAKLIGTKTYGKGMVQKIIPMPNKTGINLTIAKYLTPNGMDINKKGISPDIEINFSQEDIDTRKDVQLEKAKTILSDIIARNTH